NVVALLGKSRRKLRQGNARQLGVEQSQILSVWTELEVRMKPVGAGRSSAVFFGSKHDEILAGRQVRRRECPFARVIPIVGQRIAVKVHDGRTVIPDFYPILPVGSGV